MHEPLHGRSHDVDSYGHSPAVWYTPQDMFLLCSYPRNSATSACSSTPSCLEMLEHQAVSDWQSVRSLCCNLGEWHAMPEQASALPFQSILCSLKPWLQTTAHVWTPTKPTPGIVLQGQHMRKCFDVRKQVATNKALQLIGINFCFVHATRSPKTAVMTSRSTWPQKPSLASKMGSSASVPPFTSNMPLLLDEAATSCSTSAGLKDLLAESSVLMVMKAASGKANLTAGRR